MAVLTTDEIRDLDETELDVDMRNAILGAVVASETFQTDPAFFSDLAPRLRAIEDGAAAGSEVDTYRARMLVGAMGKLEAIGPGELEVRGDEDATWFGQRKERRPWIDYMVSVIYRMGANAVTAVPGAGAPAGGAYLGRRPDSAPRCCPSCGPRCRCGWQLLVS